MRLQLNAHTLTGPLHHRDTHGLCHHPRHQRDQCRHDGYAAAKRQRQSIGGESTWVQVFYNWLVVLRWNGVDIEIVCGLLLPSHHRRSVSATIRQDCNGLCIGDVGRNQPVSVVQLSTISRLLASESESRQ